MKIRRIQAVALRYLYLYKSGIIGRSIDLYYWPLRDIIMWGLTSIWVLTNSTSQPTVMLAMLAGVVLWNVSLRTTLVTGTSVFEELVSQNIVNLVTTPLKLHEWMLGVMSASGFLASIALVFGIVATWIIYKVPIISIGLVLAPALLILFIFGWTLGFASAAFVIRNGVRANTLVYVISWLFGPFVGIFTPLNILPLWAYKLSRFLPASYAFEAVRAVVVTGSIPLYELALGLALASIYLIIALLFFTYMFQKSRSQGLAQLQ
ncbi:MAG TPA: ABC transporter permease [Candidatus Babeliaceae bacterium]|nr:ABC transporter permease [Candidatus Babeliaceae bacterium]